MKQPMRFLFADKAFDPDNVNKVQLLRTGKFDHHFFGKFSITKKVLKDVIKNFHSNSVGVKINLDYGHQSLDEAAGWIVDMELRDDGNQLWLHMDWTPKGRQKILDREYKYTSADIDLDYLNPETGKEQGATLFGGGLTNRPFIKGMSEIKRDKEMADHEKKDLSTNKKGNTMELQEMLDGIKNLTQSEVVKLSEKMGFSKDNDTDDIKLKLTQALTENERMTSQLADTQKESKTLSEGKKKLEADLKGLQKENEFTVLLSDGKACPAQKEAFLNGDMMTFAKNSQEINLNNKGAESGDADSKLDPDAAVLKLSEKADALSAKLKISPATALKMAAKENKSLFQRARS